MTNIPDGYEFLAGRSRKLAIEALAIAEERGFGPEMVLSQRDGYFIPIGSAEIAVAEVGEVELPKETDKVADIEAFAAEWNIDLGGAKNNKERIAAIEAEIEKRTAKAEESGVLVDGSDETAAAGEETGDDESKKED